VYTSDSGIKENRAQTNRAVGNGKSESFDASCFSQLDSRLVRVTSPSGLPPATLFHYGSITHMVLLDLSSSFLLSVELEYLAIVKKTSTAV